MPSDAAIPATFASLGLSADIAKWTEVIRAAGIKPE